MQSDASRYVTKAWWSSGLAVLTGLWLVVSPFVLGFAVPEHGLGSSAWFTTAAFIAFGFVIAGLAAFHASAAHRPLWPTLILLAVGPAVFLSPLILGVTADTGVDASAILTGSLVVTLGVSAAVYTTPVPRVSGLGVPPVPARR
jgi:hypothetical protein